MAVAVISGHMRILHELVTTRGYLAISTLGLGITALCSHGAPATVHADAPALAISSSEEAAQVELAQRAHEPTPASAAIVPVFTADGSTYLAIAELDSTARTANARITETDGVTSLVSPITKKLPAAARAWQDQHVILDASCEAKVVGFAIIARLSGDPGYAEIEGATTWDAHSLLEHGHVLLAAKLDDRCRGGTFARAASAPPIQTFVDVPDDEHAVVARRRLISSPPGEEAATEWASFETGPHPGTWFDASEFSTRTVRDPRTGTEWISMHAHTEMGCGSPNINVWGLFRVDAGGTLTTVQLRPLGELSQIDRLVATDGDGIPELVGRGWIAPDAALTTAGGAELVRLDTPFFGCPC